MFDDGSGRRKSFMFNKNNFFEGVLEGMLIYFGKKNILGRYEYMIIMKDRVLIKINKE